MTVFGCVCWVRLYSLSLGLDLWILQQYPSNTEEIINGLPNKLIDISWSFPIEVITNGRGVVEDAFDQTLGVTVVPLWRIASFIDWKLCQASRVRLSLMSVCSIIFILIYERFVRIWFLFFLWFLFQPTELTEFRLRRKLQCSYIGKFNHVHKMYFHVRFLSHDFPFRLVSVLKVNIPLGFPCHNWNVMQANQYGYNYSVQYSTKGNFGVV